MTSTTPNGPVVVIGLGAMGMPVALRLTETREVRGYDVSADRVALPAAGGVVGPGPGDGQALKTVNQFLCGVHIAAAPGGPRPGPRNGPQPGDGAPAARRRRRGVLHAGRSRAADDRGARGQPPRAAQPTRHLRQGSRRRWRPSRSSCSGSARPVGRAPSTIANQVVETGEILRSGDDAGSRNLRSLGPPRRVPPQGLELVSRPRRDASGSQNPHKYACLAHGNERRIT